MGFIGSDLELTQFSQNPDASKRSLVKNMMNSIIGKFAQRQNFPKTKYVSNSESIDEIFEKGEEEIVDFKTVTESICELQTIPRISDVPFEKRENRKGNPIITAFVTSLSRIDMHKNILLLTQNKFQVLYTDTDSIIFAGPQNKRLPFDINAGLGFFKPEYSEPLTGFCCIGKKSYAINFQSQRSEAKVSGLSFTSQETKTSATFSDFKNLLETNTGLNPVPQARAKNSAIPLSVQKVIRYVQIPSTLNFNRVLRKTDKEMYTEPYGYKNDEK